MKVQNDTLRKGYELAREIAKSHGVDPDVAVKTATLLAFAKTEDGQNSLVFTFKPEDKILVTERLLREKSDFHASGFMLGLKLVYKRDGKKLPGETRIYQYPAEVFSPPVGNAVSNTANVRQLLEMVYNGVLEMRIDDKVVLEDFHTIVLRYHSMTEDVINFYFPGRYFHLKGTLENKITLKLPPVHNYMGLAGTPDFDVYAVFGFTGYEIRTDQDKIKNNF